MKSKKNNNIEIIEKEIEEKQFVEEPPKEEAVKPKKLLSESQLEALAKARVKAQERKQ